MISPEFLDVMLLKVELFWYLYHVKVGLVFRKIRTDDVTLSQILDHRPFPRHCNEF